MNRHLTALAIAVALAAGSLPAPASAARCHDVLRYLKAEFEALRNGFSNPPSPSSPWATVYEKGIVLRWGATGPVVRLLKGSPSYARADAEYAVWLVNKELPENWQLRVGKTPAARLAYYNFDEIKVAYLPRNEWPVRVDDGVGHAKHYLRDPGRIAAARVLIDHTRLTDERLRIRILLHELLHALGRWHADPDEFPDTIMHPSNPPDAPPALKDLDKAALRAVYSPRVPVGTRADSLTCDSQGRVAARQ